MEKAISFSREVHLSSKRIWTATRRHCDKEPGRPGKAIAVENAPDKIKISRAPCSSFKDALAACKTGDGCLDAACRQGEAEGMDGKDQLIDSHAFCTNCLREEYSIDKTDDFGDKSRSCEKKGSF